MFVHTQVQSSFLAVFLFFMNQIGGNLPVLVTPVKTWLHDYRLYSHNTHTSLSFISAGPPSSCSGLVALLSALFSSSSLPSLPAGKSCAWGLVSLIKRISLLSKNKNKRHLLPRICCLDLSTVIKGIFESHISSTPKISKYMNCHCAEHPNFKIGY